MIYNEIAGQWFGNVSGEHLGQLIINIDFNKSDEMSIMFDDQTGVPLVAKSFISRLPGDESFHGNLGMFRYFNQETKQEIVGFSTKDFSTDGDINFKIKGDSLLGHWDTNLGMNGNFEVKRQSSAKASPIKELISWRKFKEIISEYIKMTDRPYFRGHETSEYALNSLFNRKQCWDLYRYFDAIPELFESLGRFNNDRYSVHDAIDFGAGLLLAQHHGYPTPLIDWTLSPYVAAYFAFRDHNRKITNPTSARVFAFNARKWMIDQAWMQRAGVISPWAVIRPLSLSTGKNQRAIAQDAVSVFSNIDNIEARLTLNGRYLEYFDIDFNEQAVALKELRSMGIYEERLFLDLETVCRVHKKNYFGSKA